MNNHTPLISLTILRVAFLTSVLGALGLGNVHAASYYLQANQTSVTLDNLSYWFDQSSDAGSNPTTLNGHDFFSNGFQVRTGTSNFIFGNASTTLTLNSGNANRLALRAGPTNIITIHNLTSQGGGARIFAGGIDVKLVANNLTLTGGSTRFDADSPASNVRRLNLSVGTLTGDGDMELHGNGMTLNLNIADAIGYTGDIIWTDTTATLSFAADLTTSGGLIAPSTAKINLTQNVTFASVVLNGIALDAGIYSYDLLSSHETFGSLFLAGGSGSITVAAVPEPSTVAAILGVLTLAATVLLRRRKIRQ